MKKGIVLTLIVCIVFSLTGCRKTGDDYSSINSAPIVSNTSQTLNNESEAVKSAEILKKYFDNNINNATVAFLADVTNDDSEELIVVIEKTDDITGYVYTLKGNEVVLIETKIGGHDHATGFFAWYLAQGKDENSYYLVEETFGMWQGMGTVSLESYSFDDMLARKTIDIVKLESKNTPVNSQEFDDYINKIGNVVGKAYKIYSNYTESSQSPKPLDSNKITVFVDKTQNNHIDQTPSETIDTSSALDTESSTKIFRLGKYKGFWVGVGQEGYGYITFKDDGSCYIETNVDHKTGNLITPINTTGTYTVEQREVIYPDDSSGLSTLLTIYIGGNVFASYEGEYDNFADHWSGYEFVG